MKRYVCPVCGYVHEGDEPPVKCPQCGVPGSKLILQEDTGAKKVWACEHIIGVGNDVDPEVKQGLIDNFNARLCNVPYAISARIHVQLAFSRHKITLISFFDFSSTPRQKNEKALLPHDGRHFPPQGTGHSRQGVRSPSLQGCPTSSTREGCPRA